jgi:hypothetical protein
VGTLVYTYRHNVGLFLQRHSKAIIGSSLLAGLGLIAQLIAFRLMGDSFLQVSALVKTSGAGSSSGTGQIERFVEVFLLGMPSILQGRFPTLVLVLMGLSGIVLAILALRVIRDDSDEMRALVNLWSCLLVGEIIYYLYIGLSGAEYRPYFIWYRSPSFIFWILTGSLLTLFLFVHPRLVKLSDHILKWAPVGFSFVIFAVALYMFARNINFTSKLYATRYNAALWIAENSPSDTVFASWNAGQLGFFSDRTFINLDGLINNVDYYERVLQGSTSLTEYLTENHVKFIVDYATYASIPDFPVVHSFPLNDGSGRSIQIWQVSPQLSSAP